MDGKTKASWNLRTTAQARIDVLSDNGSERSLQLVVGTSTYVREMLRDLEVLPLQYALHPSYPNPSTGPVALKMSLPQDEDVTVDVYNLLGQRVATLKNGEPMSAGVHTVLWKSAPPWQWDVFRTSGGRPVSEHPEIRSHPVEE